MLFNIHDKLFAILLFSLNMLGRFLIKDDGNFLERFPLCLDKPAISNEALYCKDDNVD